MKREALNSEIMVREIIEGLTFDDVLLVPGKNELNSRSDYDLTTKLTKNILLNVPLVSANMDTVTEYKMAITLAREGGIGIIHRYLSIEDQVKHVLRVKRAESYVVEKPYTFSPNKTLEEAKEIMQKYDVNSLLIIDEEKKLVGLLSNRDYQFVDDNSILVNELMTRRSELIVSSKGISLEDAKKILFKHKIEKLPLVNQNNTLEGLITAKDIIKKEEHSKACKDAKGRLRVGAAIGVVGDYFERAKALIDSEVDVLVVDVAHGHSSSVVEVVKNIKSKYDIDIIAGNVATAEGTKELIEAGADAIKIGIGPGAVCTTRIVSGAGVPQISAILDCYKIAKKYSVPIIGDGGITKPGDVTKAIASGANSVMIGNLFAGTDESPGKVITKGNKAYKFYRGMASLDANVEKESKGLKLGKSVEKYVPEGVNSLVEYKGSVVGIINQLLGGLQSGMSYCGTRTIPEMQENSVFVKITNAGLKESYPHDVKIE